MEPPAGFVRARTRLGVKWRTCFWFQSLELILVTFEQGLINVRGRI